MGKKQIISISILLIMCLAMTGCSKDADSVSFVGVWDIDTSSFTIVYNEQVYSTHPEAIMFLKNNRDNIVKSRMSCNAEDKVSGLPVASPPICRLILGIGNGSADTDTGNIPMPSKVMANNPMIIKNSLNPFILFHSRTFSWSSRICR